MHLALPLLVLVAVVAAGFPALAEETTYPANTPYAVEEREGWRIEVWMNTAPGKDRPFNVTILIYDAETRERLAPGALLEILRPNRTALAAAEAAPGERIGVLTRPDAAGTHTIRVAFPETDGRHDLSVAVEVKAFKERRTGGFETAAILGAATVAVLVAATRRDRR